VNKTALRKTTVETLGLLAERFPNLRLAQIISNSITGSVPDLYYLSDEEFARGLNQLFVSYTQFEAAGIKP
jgi:hypothetical protein